MRVHSYYITHTNTEKSHPASWCTPEPKVVGSNPALLKKDRSDLLVCPFCICEGIRTLSRGVREERTQVFMDKDLAREPGSRQAAGSRAAERDPALPKQGRSVLLIYPRRI